MIDGEDRDIDYPFVKCELCEEEYDSLKGVIFYDGQEFRVCENCFDEHINNKKEEQADFIKVDYTNFFDLIKYYQKSYIDNHPNEWKNFLILEELEELETTTEEVIERFCWEQEEFRKTILKGLMSNLFKMVWLKNPKKDFTKNVFEKDEQKIKEFIFNEIKNETLSKQFMASALIK